MLYLIPISIVLLAAYISVSTQFSLRDDQIRQIDAISFSIVATILIILSAIVGFFIRPKSDFKNYKKTKLKGVLRVVYRILALAAIGYNIHVIRSFRDQFGISFSIAVAAYCVMGFYTGVAWLRGYRQALLLFQSHSAEVPVELFGISHFRILHFDSNLLKCRFMPDLQDLILFSAVLAVNVMFVSMIWGDWFFRFNWKGNEWKVIFAGILISVSLVLFKAIFWNRIGSLRLTKEEFFLRKGFATQKIKRSEVDSLEIHEDILKSTYTDHSQNTRIWRTSYSYGAAIYAKLTQNPQIEKYVIAIDGKNEENAALIRYFLILACRVLGW